MSLGMVSRSLEKSKQQDALYDPNNARLGCGGVSLGRETGWQGEGGEGVLSEAITVILLCSLGGGGGVLLLFVFFTLPFSLFIHLLLSLPLSLFDSFLPSGIFHQLPLSLRLVLLR